MANERQEQDQDDQQAQEEGQDDRDQAQDGRQQGGRAQRDNGLTAVDAAERAREQVTALLGLDSDTISSVSRAGDGWQVRVEVVELRRLPPSTDVLATYDVELDGDGSLAAYERSERYLRGAPARAT